MAEDESEASTIFSPAKSLTEISTSPVLIIKRESACSPSWKRRVFAGITHSWRTFFSSKSSTSSSKEKSFTERRNSSAEVGEVLVAVDIGGSPESAGEKRSPYR
jgi:hypothetical protein